MFTILSIEDNLMNINLMRRYFKAGDYRLLEARTGAEGLLVAAANYPDLVIIDIHLPDMNGRDVLSLLRKIEGLENVPAIAFTADTTRILEKQTLSEGFNAHLNKPISVGHLLATIEKLLLINNPELIIA